MISFANPWGLLGLAAVPAVLWLHLYRVRFAPLAIGGLFLWDDSIRRPAGGRTRDRLRSTPSLWLELLAAAALGLLLGGPRVSWETTAPHLVAVLDGSASMTATAVQSKVEKATAGEPVKPAATFRDAAVVELGERAAALGSSTRLTVIETGSRPRVVGGPRGQWRDVLADLADRPAPTRPRHEFAPALDLAARLAADGGQVLMLTDRNPRSLALPEGATAISVGAPRANVALLAVDRRPSDAGEELFLRAKAYGPTGPVTAVVEVASTDDGGGAGGTRIERPLALSPVGAATLTLPLPPTAAGRRVKVRLIATDDALTADSKATLLPEPVRPVRVAITLPDGPTASALERAVDSLPDVRRGDPAVADLRFTPPGSLGAAGDGTWVVAVGSVPGGEASDRAGPFLIDRADPLAAGVSLAGTIWGGAGPGEPGPGEPGEEGGVVVSPVIAAGDRALLGRVVGTVGTGDAGAFILNVDAARGTLAATPDWPILISNLVEARRAALPGPDRANLRLGEAARLRLTAAQQAATGPLILRPLSAESTGDAAIELPREAEAAIAPPAAGLWVVLDGAGGAELGRFSVRLADPREADLTGLSPGLVEPDENAAEGTAVDDPAPWPVALLAIAALAAVVSDWFVLRPVRPPA